jgi:adenylate cyclase
MANAGVTRKLAVILAADVAGYSRLMAADEEGTLATLNARRQVIDEMIARHHGRIFTTAGDSVMAEFASAVEAVRCAAAIQQEIERRNADLPEPRRMLFRVGVNLGDVMVGGDNLFGDGVNVAARLEGMAEPGGICVSGAVYDQIRRPWRAIAEEHRLSGARLRPAARPRRARHVGGTAGRGAETLCLAVDRRAAVREPRQRSRA